MAYVFLHVMCILNILSSTQLLLDNTQKWHFSLSLSLITLFCKKTFFNVKTPFLFFNTNVLLFFLFEHFV